MKRTLIAAALISAIAAPVAAQTPLEFAVEHFNSSQDNANDRVILKGGDNTVSVSTRSGLWGDIFAHFNASADNQGDLRGLNGATIVSGTPAYGADVFAAELARADGADR